MTVLLWAVSTERQFKVSTFFGNQGKTAELKMTSGTKRDQLGSTASQKWWRSSAKKRVCPKRTQTTVFERQPLLSGPMQGFQIATSWPFEAIAVNSPCWATLNSRPSTSKLDNCSHVLSRALSPSTSNHSQQFSAIFSNLSSFQCQFGPNKCLRDRSSAIALFKTWKWFSTIESVFIFKWLLATVFCFLTFLQVVDSVI